MKRGFSFNFGQRAAHHWSWELASSSSRVRIFLGLEVHWRSGSSLTSFWQRLLVVNKLSPLSTFTIFYDWSTMNHSVSSMPLVCFFVKLGPPGGWSRGNTGFLHSMLQLLHLRKNHRKVPAWIDFEDFRSMLAARNQCQFFLMQVFHTREFWAMNVCAWWLFVLRECPCLKRSN